MEQAAAVAPQIEAPTASFTIEKMKPSQLELPQWGIVIYDTEGRSVLAWLEWDEKPDFVAFKAEVINAVEKLTDQYITMTLNLGAESEKTAATMKTKPIFAAQQAMMLGQRASGRAEQTMIKLMDYNGGDFSCVVPYCLVASEKQDGKDIISFRHCRPWVNGHVVFARYT